MAVQEISKERFDSYHPLRQRPADNAFTSEVAWFEDSEADTIGVIIESKRHDDFSVVSFANSNGYGFYPYDVAVSISSFSGAKKWIGKML